MSPRLSDTRALQPAGRTNLSPLLSGTRRARIRSFLAKTQRLVISGACRGIALGSCGELHRVSVALVTVT